MIRMLASFLGLGVLVVAGCAAPWQGARAAIATGRVATGTLEAELSRIDNIDHERADQALEIARDGLALGDTIVNAWEQSGGDAPVGWQKWAVFALAGLKDVIRIIDAAGVAIPQPVLMAVSVLNLIAMALGA